MGDWLLLIYLLRDPLMLLVLTLVIVYIEGFLNGLPYYLILTVAPNFVTLHSPENLNS